MKKRGWLMLVSAVGLGWLVWKLRKEKEEIAEPIPTRTGILIEPDEKGGCRLADLPVKDDPLPVYQRQRVAWEIESHAATGVCDDVEVRVLGFRSREFPERKTPFELPDNERPPARRGGVICDRVKRDASPGVYKYDIQLTRDGQIIQVIDPEVRVRPWP